MLEGGEDPEFIARRLIILASEDIGLADPHALPLRWRPPTPWPTSGCPKRPLHLTEATIYLAAAPKSNSVGRAMAKSAANSSRMAHLERSAPSAVGGIPGRRETGSRFWVRDAHDFEGGVVPSSTPERCPCRGSVRAGGAW